MLLEANQECMRIVETERVLAVVHEELSGGTP